MNVAIIGGTGFVGTQVLREVLGRGHSVKAVLRDPSKCTVQDRNLSVVRCDVYDTDALSATFRGSDAILSCFNPGWTDPQIRENTSRGYASILLAARQAGVKRLLIMGGAGSLYVAPGVQLLDTPQFPAEWRPGAEGARDVLNTLRGETALEWTFLSPSMIIDPAGERTGRFRTGTDAVLADDRGESRISLADLSVAFVDEMEKGAHIRRRFTVGY